jgi:WD40 repeat protein
VTHLSADNNISVFSFPIPDEAHYKKFDEYAPKDSKSTENKKSDKSNSQASKANNVKSSKRSNLKKRSDKTNYSHNWLLTTLKGHTGSVLDMSFSANGKYLATCADGKSHLDTRYVVLLSNKKSQLIHW